jgi:hypothetical protein
VFSLHSCRIVVFHNYVSMVTSFFYQQQWHLIDLSGVCVHDPKLLTKECNGIYTQARSLEVQSAM